MVRLISRVMSSARADSKTGSAQELWRMSVRLPWNFTFPTFLTMRGKTVCHYQNIIALSPDRQYIDLLRILQDLYKLGFRVISQEVNMVVGADENGIYNFLEIVFMKEN